MTILTSITRWRQVSNTIFKPILPIIFLALLVAGCKEEGLNFIHNNHLERGLECPTCHIQTEDLPSLPDEDICRTCHEIDRNNPSDKCRLCHRGKEEKSKPRDRKNYADLQFSHKNHLEREIKCEECHGTAKDGYSIPVMEDCIRCHSQIEQKIDCSKCHMKLKKDERPQNHDYDWKTRHGKEITLEGGSPENQRCYICHNQASCDTCHKDEKPQNHTNQWRLRGHQVMGRINRSQCAACHRQDFCVSCHSEAPAIPNNSSHRPGRSCSLCHVRLSHSVTDETGCTRCHAN